MKSFAFVCLMMAGTLCRGEMAPTVAALPEAQRAALQKAVCFAESKEVVHNVFAELAVAPAGTGQREALRAELADDNLSMFCMAGPLNRDDAAAEFEYGVPALDQITQVSMHTVELGTVVGLDDVTAISWQDDVPGQAHGSFQFDTKCGNKGTCLFQAQQEGEAWTFTRLAIQKKGSDLIADGWPVFDFTEATE